MRSVAAASGVGGTRLPLGLGARSTTKALTSPTEVVPGFPAHPTWRSGGPQRSGGLHAPCSSRAQHQVIGSGPALPTALVPEEPPEGRSQPRSGRVPSSQRSNHRACLQVSGWRVETGHPQASPRRPSPLPSRVAAPPRIGLPGSHLGSDSSVFPGDAVALHGDGRTRP